jgi:hypothetical protein
MTNAKDSNLEGGAKIVPDRTFRTGNDDEGYRMRYEDGDKVFWFDCLIEFDQSDGNAYDVTVSRIGIKEVYALEQISFEAEDLAKIRRNIHNI